MRAIVYHNAIAPRGSYTFSGLGKAVGDTGLELLYEVQNGHTSVDWGYAGTGISRLFV